MFKLGPMTFRWYGFMYILGFTFGYLILKKRMRETGVTLAGTLPGDLVVYMITGVLVGARLGYVLFYKPVDYFLNPGSAMQFWAGGMSFHGGLIGALIAGFVFCKQNKIDFYRLADTLIPAVPIGLGLGRLGNFINGELWGRASDVPWAMVFPSDPAGLPRHPSQLYELGLEGVVLALVLWGLRHRGLPSGALFWIFVTGYGVCRLVAEQFREPDAHLSYLIPHVSAGMVITAPMLLLGGFMLWRTLQGPKPALRPAAE
jgi:phosphatidylglycerol:prolipoprotein diacylglycerol transferase